MGPLPGPQGHLMNLQQPLALKWSWCGLFDQFGKKCLSSLSHYCMKAQLRCWPLLNSESKGWGYLLPAPSPAFLTAPNRLIFQDCTVHHSSYTVPNLRHLLLGRNQVGKGHHWRVSFSKVRAAYNCENLQGFLSQGDFGRIQEWSVAKMQDILGGHILIKSGSNMKAS